MALVLGAESALADSGGNASPSVHTAAPSAGQAASAMGNWIELPAWLPPWLQPVNWPFTLIPLPEVVTDPNAGTTVGVLPVFLFNDDQHHIRQILAPDVNYNSILGAGGAFRYLAYPSSDTQWYAIAGASREIARRVDLYYSTGRTRQDWWSFDGRLFYERDPTERFFGLGNDSRESAQSNYSTQQLYLDASLGLNLTHELQITLEERPRYIRIDTGALSKTLPFIGTSFPTLKGLDGGSEVMTRAVAAYDTRDSIDIPTRGGLARVFGGVVDRSLLSSVSYTQFGAELREFYQVARRVILAGRLYAQYTPAGGETPFWAMSRLGGQEAVMAYQQTLRGYGAGRFVDNNLSVANLEARTRVFEATIFDTHGIIEVAPFAEAGRVFHDAAHNPVAHLHPVLGAGLRAIAEPFVVGFLDFGVGGEGLSIFSGINYPF